MYLHVVAALPPEIAGASDDILFHLRPMTSTTTFRKPFWNVWVRQRKVDSSSCYLAKSWATSGRPNYCIGCDNFSERTHVMMANSRFFGNYSCNGCPGQCAWFSRGQMKRPLIDWLNSPIESRNTPL